jgi:hypothetical protein
MYNKEVNEVVLENASKSAKYTSPDVQKEILRIFARKVQKSIREEIGSSKCIMVDEARDESKKEQMAIVLRFVNKDLQKNLFLT